MADEFISRQEHEEFCRRMEEHDTRQDKRIENIEDEVKSFRLMQTSIEKLAVNMENMCKEQVSQGKRLATLEERDGEKWRSVVGYVVAAVVGTVVGYMLKQIGIF